jgi:predicted metalloprotease with PDZ domain
MFGALHIIIISENLSYTKAVWQPHTPHGVSVGAAVLDGGAAQLAGLATGDLLASINGERVIAARWDEILSYLITGQIIQICFYRDDLEHECMTVLEDDQIPAQYILTPAE